MRNPLHFFLDLLRQPPWVPTWMLYLMLINLASLGFWQQPLAKLIFGVFLLSVVLTLALYSRLGFVKLLGLGHLPWMLLVPYLAAKLPVDHNDFDLYLIIFLISVSISLLVDAVEVWRYCLSGTFTSPQAK